MNRASRGSANHTILVFQHRRAAEKAVHALLAAGVTAARISFFMRATPKSGKAAVEVDEGADYGGTLGAGIGAMAGFALFAVPGLGPVVGTGTLAAALTGAIFGGSIGGVTGALIEAGLSEADAALAEHHLREGKAVVVVRNDDDRQNVAGIGRSQGAVQVAEV